MNTTSQQIDQIIGAVAFKIVQRQLGDSPEADRPFFRLKNLTTGENLAFFKKWQEEAHDTRLGQMTLVVSSDASPEFPDEFRADPYRSFTDYRNNNEHGLVYVETKVESDAQGLKNIFDLSDRNFLDGTFDSENFSIPHLISENASLVAGNATSAHQGSSLNKRIIEALNHLHPKPFPISVRRFTAFALSVMTEKARRNTTLDANEIDQIVGQKLVELGLFPDEYWRSENVDSKISRRLELNFLRAELAGSSHSDLDTEKIKEQLKTYVFKDISEIEYDQSLQTKWRQLCTDYVDDPKPEIREKIPYQIFSQLFSKDIKGLKLGERIETEIKENYSERLAEFEDLKVKDGLDKRREEDANKLLESEPKDETLAPISSLLSPQTLQMVERAAHPNPESFSNPLIKITEIAQKFIERNERNSDRWQLSVKITGSNEAVSESVGLFSFLYGKTLISVIEDSKIDPSGIELEVDSRLISSPVLPDIKPTTDSEAESALTWGPIGFEFSLISKTSKKQIDSETAYEWLPDSVNKTALFWILLADKNGPKPYNKLLLPKKFNFDEWVKEIATRSSQLANAIEVPFSKEVKETPIIQNVVAIYEAFKKEINNSGLSSGALLNFFDQWQEEILEAKAQFVPDGRQDLKIDALLGMSCLYQENQEKVWMLGSHPFRLRWLGKYLEKSEHLLTEALAGTLPLNKVNGNFYLDWISSLSPQQQPAVTCSESGNLLLASGESGWMEEFSPLRNEGTATAGQLVDKAAIKELTAQVHSYLTAHPFKKDGLSILILVSDSPKLPRDLILSLRTGAWVNTEVHLHILAPTEIWELISESFHDLPGENRLSSGNRIFPPTQISFHELNDSSNFEEALDQLTCDIAIIPKFLNSENKLQENTELGSEESGQFNPLLDKPTHVYGGTQGGAISVAMRPKGSAMALNAWSTLAIRQHRGRPVSPQSPENNDYAEIIIDFARTAQLFEKLHEVSHWVITLERYIAREQLESLESKPDILTIKENVGLSGAFTLIVSSNSGRSFIIDRLCGKLQRISGQPSDSTLAEVIYDETRVIAPRLALKAMGLSRVTEEILGLKIARRITDHVYPTKPEDGMIAWISLDEHPEWFPRNNVMADLCRISFNNTEEDLEVDILIVEGKLRRKYDSHGEFQVISTLDLFDEILGANDDKKETDRLQSCGGTEIACAIDDLSPEAKTFFGTSATSKDAQNHELPRNILEKFREGKISRKNSEGCFSICLHESEGDISIELGSNPRLKIIKSYRNEFLNIVKSQINLDNDNREQPTPSSSHPTNVPPTENGDSDPPTAQKDNENESSTSVDENGDQPTEILEGSKGDEGEASSNRKLSQSQLEESYQVILDTFAQFNVPVHQPTDKDQRFIEGPASVLFRIKPGLAIDPKNIYAKADSLKLGLELESQHAIKFDIHRGHVTIDVPKFEEDRYFVSARKMWRRWTKNKDGLEIPIGEDRFGNVVSINFSSTVSPHLLIGGTTGSGKSEALNTILEGLTRHYSPEELQLQLIDPKTTELVNYEDCELLVGEIGFEPLEAIGILEDAVAEMQRRYGVLREARANSITKFNANIDAENRLPWRVIVLDEYGDLTTEASDKRAIEALLKRLAQKARAAGIHVIIATQKPSAEVISTNLRSNLPAQLALQVKSGIESRVIMDDQGAETLNGKGDAFLKLQGKLTRVQCALVD